MTLKEPQIWLNIEFGHDFSFTIFTSLFRDMRNAVKHQHGRQRQLCIACAKHLAVTTGKKLFATKLVALNHKQRSSSGVINKHPAIL